MEKQTFYTLSNGVKIPAAGFGTYKAADGKSAEVISTAIEAGYRCFDTASFYETEGYLAEAIEKSGIPREEFFITSKLWKTEMGYQNAKDAFERSLERLKTDYLDLYLIHWPVPGCYTGTWLEMAKLLETGRVLSIGVSNFQIHHLEELKKISGIVPAVNQIECHPLCYPKELIEYCQSEGIQVQAYAPLARGAYLDNDVMCVLGTKYAHTPAQVGLRWAIQKGISVIPKSVNPDRIASNANIFDFNIEDEDMAIMDTLNEDLHTSHVPDDLKDVIF